MDFIRRILNDDNGFCFHLVKEGNNEDAEPFYDNQLLTVCDGLGGSGNSKHSLSKPLSFQQIKAIVLPEIGEGNEMDTYLNDLFLPLIDNTLEHTSALWGSRIAIARYTYAIKTGIRDENKIRDFVINGFYQAKEKLGFSIIKRDGISMFSTTMASIVINCETKTSVDIDVYWAGDSRCYCLSSDGLQQLSDDHENDAGMTNLFCIDSTINSYVSKRHYNIKKPCILFSCSDGFFDVTSFVCEVEEAFMKFIFDSKSMDEFKCKTAELYDCIKGDDCTIALKAFGFKNFDEIKKSLTKRFEYIKKYVKNVHDFQEYVKYTENPEISKDTIGKMASRFETKKEATLMLLSENIDDPFVESIVDKINEEVQDAKKRMEAAIFEKKKKVLSLLHAKLRVRENPIDINEIFTDKVASIEKSQKSLAVSNSKYVITNKLFRKMCSLKACIEEMLSPYNVLVSSLHPFFRKRDNLTKQMKDSFKKDGFNFGELSLNDSYSKGYGIISPEDAEAYLNQPIITLCFESGKLDFTKEELLELIKEAYQIASHKSEDRNAEALYYKEIDSLFNENKNPTDYLYSLLNKEAIALNPLLDEVSTLISEIDNYKETNVTNEDYKRAISSVIATGNDFLKYYDLFLEKYGLTKETVATTYFNSSLIKSYKLIFDLSKNQAKYAGFAREMTVYDENYYHYIKTGE